MRLLLPVILLIVSALASEPLEAAKLVYKNGDSISGTLDKTENGIIYFKSDHFGEVTVPATDAQVIPDQSKPIDQSQAAVTVNTELPKASASLKKKAAQKQAEKSGTPSTVAQSGQTTPPPSVKSVERAVKKSQKPKWKRTVEFGFATESGKSSKTDLSMRAQADRKTKDDEVRAQGDYSYGKTDGEISSDRFSSLFRWRHEVSKDNFAQSETDYGYDRVKQVNHDISQSFGLGRKLLNSDDLELSVGSGATARYLDQIGNRNQGMTYLVNAFQDASYTINDHFKVTQDSSFLFPPQNHAQFSVKLHAALVGKLTDSLNMSMRYEFDYDRSLDPGSRRTQRLMTSLGYAF